jgi:hypothetical protein
MRKAFDELKGKNIFGKISKLKENFFQQNFIL